MQAVRVDVRVGGLLGHGVWEPRVRDPRLSREQILDMLQCATAHRQGTFLTRGLRQRHPHNRQQDRGPR